MSIYDLAYQFISLLLGDMVNTGRGALVAEYFGYLIIGITIYLLVKFAIWLVTFPIDYFKNR